MTSVKRTILGLCLMFAIGPANTWDSALLAVPMMVNGHGIPYSVFAIYVMPGSPISVGLVDATGEGDGHVW